MLALFIAGVLNGIVIYLLEVLNAPEPQWGSPCTP